MTDEKELKTIPENASASEIMEMPLVARLNYLMKNEEVYDAIKKRIRFFLMIS